MKSTTSIVALACALFSSVAIAKDCTSGLEYCGSTLLNIGYSQDTIDKAIKAASETPEEDQGASWLFDCNDGGEISFAVACDHACTGADDNINDHCSEVKNKVKKEKKERKAKMAKKEKKEKKA